MSPVSEELRPPVRRIPVLAWLQQNLFSSWLNSGLTLVMLFLIFKFSTGIVGWLQVANWDPVTTSPRLYLVGQYPAEYLWRPALALGVIAFLFGLSWGQWGGVARTFAVVLLGGLLLAALLPLGMELKSRLIFGAAALAIGGGQWVGKRPWLRPAWLLGGWLVALPLTILLLNGVPGSSGQLAPVLTTVWGGIMLNLVLAVVGILACFPLGVLLALGRQSKLPVLRAFSILYIEIVRGVPLVSVLFMFSVILPLFLPEDTRLDRVLRALIGITLFSGAYMAENIRGGLQAIPRGQYEAAHALGLNRFQTTFLIVMPQALRLVIPAIVGQFIALFKDTTLVVIVGLTDILGIGKSIFLGRSEWIGAQAEVYLFIAAVFWIFTYGMSYGSQQLEKALGVGKR